MRQFSSLVRSVVFCGVTLTAVAGWGQDARPLPTVVAKTRLQQRVNDKPIPFAEAGQVLPVLQEKPDTILVQAANGMQGWVQKSAVAPLQEAAPIYDALIKKDPRNANLYVLRGNVWAAKGDAERAVDDFGFAIQLGNRDAQLLVNRGVFHASLGRFDEAIADYDAAIELGAKGIPVYTNRGAAFLAKQAFDKSVADYSEVIRLAPDRSEGYIQRGIAYQRKEDFENAIRDFSKSLQIAPGNIVAVGHRGFAYYQMGDHENAVKDFSEAIRISPDDGVAYNNRGFNRQMLSDYKGALEDYDNAIRLTPTYALSYQNKAWLLATCPEEDVRDGKAALATAEKLCQMREYKVFSDLKALAAAHAELGNFEKAVEVQTKVVELTDGDQKTTEEEILKLYLAKQPFRLVAGSGS